MSNFYLVCGISGGGKTVLTERIVKKNSQLKVFDVDKYYERVNGDECNRANWFDVWQLLYRELHEAELNKQDIILTTNALTVSQRTQFLEWFPTFKHHILWVTAPYEKCLEGNQNRRRHLPENKLKADWYRMEFPNANEAGWDTIVQITNLWDNENYIIFELKGKLDIEV